MKWIAVYIMLLLQFCGYGQVYYTDLYNADVALQQNNFSKYNYWIQEAEKNYKENPNFCGNGQEAYYHHLTLLDAMYKDKTGKTTEAIRVLLPIAINRGLTGEDYSAISTLKTILLHKYKPAQIKQQITNALDSITISNYDIETYLMPLFGTMQRIYPMDAIEYYAYKRGIRPTQIPDSVRDSLSDDIASAKDAAPYMKAYIKDTYFYKTMIAD